MALDETAVWIFMAWMVVPLVALLIVWIYSIVRSARKRAKKRVTLAEAAE
jgi:preprotein translocase subunit YajC